MQHPLPLFTAFSLFIATASTATAQCLAGEMEVTIDVITDDYGNETYWQLVPFGNVCDQAPLFIGGNMVITCANAGDGTSPAGGYANNSTIPEGPWCLTEGAQYSIIAMDSYGDGQASFNVYADGASIGQFSGNGGTNTWTFTVMAPAMRDMGVVELNTPLFNTVGVNTPFSGTVKNFGGVPVTDFTLHFVVGGTEVFASDVSGVSVPSGGSYEFFIDGSWIPATTGSALFEVWADNINGGNDEVPANDLRTADLVVNEAIPDIIADYLILPPVLVPVADDDEDLLVPRDLDFHPDRTRNEIWVINKDLESTGGSTVKFTDAGEATQNHLWQRDGNAWHFMNLPTGIALGDNNNFSTCPGVFDANHNGGDPFTGISLWSSDPAIYAQPSGGNGSHLDMLHVTPNAQGICHERWNRYWVVDGYNQDVVMHDFRADHGPGNDYHGNAIIRRYAEINIQMDPNEHIVSHCVLDKSTGWLYVVDNGNARVVRLDTHSGSAVGNGSYLFGQENYAEYSQMGGHTWETVANTGLVQPAGIELVGTHLLVSDYSNGDIVVYDIAQPGLPEIGRIATGAGGIMGIALGYDGHIWYVNATTNALVRIDPDQNVGVHEATLAGIQVYPNPANDHLFLSNTLRIDAQLPVVLFDATGRVVLRTTVGLSRTGIDVAQLAPGAYTITIADAAQRVVIAR